MPACWNGCSMHRRLRSASHAVDYQPSGWTGHPTRTPSPRPRSRQPAPSCWRTTRWNSGTSRRVYANDANTGRFPGIDEIAAVLYHRPDAAATARRGGRPQGTAGERAPSRPSIHLSTSFLEVDDCRRPGFQRRGELPPRLQALDGPHPANTGPEPRRRAPTELQCAPRNQRTISPSQWRRSTCCSRWARPNGFSNLGSSRAL